MIDLICHKGWDSSQLMYIPTAELDISYNHRDVNSSHPSKNIRKVDELHPKGACFSPLAVRGRDGDQL